jgi:methionine sulfoxide reductase heme-binding subunit
MAAPAAGRSAASRARRRLLKRAVGAVALTPAAVLGGRALLGALGANPIAEALNQTGYWALVTLLAGLACTPLNLLFSWNWPLQVRRLLGLVAFVYACLHFSIYLVLEQFFSWDDILQDIVKRKFITVGFLALVILVPLAVTSTGKMVKRLGFPRWKRLHRLVYAAAVLAVVHFVWRVKADLLEPLIYVGVLALLLAVRVLAWVRSRRAAGSAAPAASV